MAPEVHQASPSGEFGVVGPCLVRAVGVMEDEVGGVDLPQIPGGYQLVHLLDRVGVAVGKVDPQEPVRRARRVHHHLRLVDAPAERFLAEDGEAALQGPDRLGTVPRAGGGDDDGVETEVEQGIQRVDHRAPRDELCRFLRVLGADVGNGGDLRLPALGYRLHPVPADPPGPKEPYPRQCLLLLHCVPFPNAQ